MLSETGAAEEEGPCSKFVSPACEYSCHLPFENHMVCMENIEVCAPSAEAGDITLTQSSIALSSEAIQEAMQKQRSQKQKKKKRKNKHKGKSKGQLDLEGNLAEAAPQEIGI